MSLRAFAIVVVGGGLLAATLLALATLLDAPVLYIPALGAIVGILVAREAWKWEGDVRGWVAMFVCLLGVIALVATIQRIAD